jgi:hypothetical protein
MMRRSQDKIKLGGDEAQRHELYFLLNDAFVHLQDLSTHSVDHSHRKAFQSLAKAIDMLEFVPAEPVAARAWRGPEFDGGPDAA